MASIFEKETADSFIRRIDSLTPVTQHLWGTMTVSQMLAHIQQPILVALGETTPKRSFFSRIFGPLIKVAVVNEKPFKQDLPTDASFIIGTEKNFDQEKQQAIQLISRLSEGGHAGISGRKHPLFGKMTPEEWDVLTIKHLDHHLRQFGV